MKALTIGSATIDTIAIIESELVERMLMYNAESSFLLLEEGRKTDALEVSAHCGGGASNTAVALARLGFETGAMIRIGNDARAAAVLDKLSREGVAINWVVRDARAPTGASVLISAHDRNAAVFTFRGANSALEAADLDDAAFAVDLVFVSNLSSQSANTFPLIVEKAKKSGARVASNPGTRQLMRLAREFMSSLSRVDILALNRAEADVLVASLPHDGAADKHMFEEKNGVPLPALAERGLIGAGCAMGLRAFLRALLGKGVGCVLLTDGRNGAFAAVANRIYFCPIMDTEVAGTAGAGDAFAATFAAYSVQSAPPEIALRAATLNAAAVLRHVDTQTGLMTQKAMRQCLETWLEPPVSVWEL